MRRLLLPLILAFAAGGAGAAVQTESLRYSVDGDTHIGYLAYDDAITEPRPGVLVVPEWWGLNDYAKQRARDLAELGYVAFAADMYGEGRTTTDPEQAGEWSGAAKPALRSLARAGLDVLAGHDRVDTDRLAAIGFCFGGTSVLQLAYSSAAVDGVVSFHGNLPTPGDDDDIRAAIRVEHGAADPMVPPADVADFMTAMNERDGVDWQFHAHGGAVHAFTNPAADDAGMDGVAYDQTAAHRAWNGMQDFLEQVFEQVAMP